MICPNCKTEFDGDRCPQCGLRIPKGKEPPIPSIEAGPERLSMRTTLGLVWEGLKAMYFVIGLMVLGILLIVGLMLLVSWCAGGS
jgi:hypothetical protein